jgi:hypothetical protein
VRPELEALVQKALAKKKSDRFDDAGQMLAALEAIASPAAWIDPTGRSRPSAMTLPSPASTAAANPAPEISAPSLAQPPSASSGLGRNTTIAILVGLFLLVTVVGGGLTWLLSR